MPAQLNKPSLATLSVLTRAIHRQTAVKTVYRSLSSGRTMREIVPFVLVDNGLRWHVRGYDRRQSRFSDFVITGIFDPTIIDSVIKEHETRESDIQWNRIVAPEPQASENHSQRLRHEKRRTEHQCAGGRGRLRAQALER